MENAADALKIGFALLVFVVALSTVFMMISKTKATADVILYYADNTNYRLDLDNDDTGINRIVKKSDVISTLYRYFKESMSVTVVLGSDEYVFDIGNENMNGNERKLNSEDDIKNNLADFIEDHLNPLNDSTEFMEEFIEVPTSGIYYVDRANQSEIELSPGSRKVYVTYTQQ